MLTREATTVLQRKTLWGLTSWTFSTYGMILAQIAVIDIVFSFDSVITAVGMAEDVPVMVIAIIIAVGVMMFAAKSIGEFVDNHPSIKMLALSFLILVGVVLIGEGLDMHIYPRATSTLPWLSPS